MALTATKYQDLTDKGFVKLLKQHNKLWRKMAGEAFEYTSAFVAAAGLPVRPDDVVDLLAPALGVSEEFRAFLEKKRLRQKYWRVWFGELIIDQLWDELTEEDDEDGEEEDEDD